MAADEVGNDLDQNNHLEFEAVVPLLEDEGRVEMLHLLGVPEDVVLAVVCNSPGEVPKDVEEDGIVDELQPGRRELVREKGYFGEGVLEAPDGVLLQDACRYVPVLEGLHQLIVGEEGLRGWRMTGLGHGKAATSSSNL